MNKVTSWFAFLLSILDVIIPLEKAGISTLDNATSDDEREALAALIALGED